MRTFVCGCALGVLAGAGATAGAHHSVLGFDGTRGVTVSGVVREVAWRNPHTYITLDNGSAGENGESWVIETEGASVLERLGWTRTSVRPGDRIRSLGAPARDGRRVVRCEYVEPAKGPHLPCVPAGPL